MDTFTLSSERSPWFQNNETHRFGPPQGSDIVIWMSLEIGKIWVPKLPILQTKDTFLLHTSPKNPCLEGMLQRIPKKDDKNSNYNLSGSTSRNYTWVGLSARFGTVKLKVSRRSLYMLCIQIRLKLNHEDFHTQTLNVWYLYLQLVILLAK